MASKITKEDLSCPVCHTVFSDPVLLHCTHSVCKVCLQQFWESKETRECPVCRRKSSKESPPINLALKNLCESFLQKEESSDVCSLHSEKLKLFCLDDQQLVCLVCRDSKKHTNHKFCPTDEAVIDCKEKVKTALKSLQETFIHFKDCKLTWSQTAEHIKIQAHNTENQIKEQFEKLHQFLQDEEADRIAALRKEEGQKSQVMKENIENLNSKMLFLADTIRAIEKEIDADDVTFLQNYKTTVKRAQCTPEHPEAISGPLIHVTQHLANLKFRVWEKMQGTVQYTPVILDPNTAHPKLVVSDDLTSVRCTVEKQMVPENPERFDEFTCVLGSEGFNSGTHCWDVKVGDSTMWAVGVIAESALRKGKTNSRHGLWFIRYYNGTYRGCSTPGLSTSLSVEPKLQRIRVQLDWDRGNLSFSNPLTNTHIHTFMYTFTEKLLPFINVVCEAPPLKICSHQCSIIVN